MVEGIYRMLVSYRTGDMWAPQLDTSEALSTEALHFIDCITQGTPPLTGGEVGWRVVKVLEAAVVKAGSTDPKKIQAALSAGMTVNGALGPVKYKGHGQHNPTNVVVVDQIKGGKFVKVLKSVPKGVPAP